MREPDASQFRKRREDVVVSVCFSDVPTSPAAFQTVRDVAATLDHAYRFREIILVVDDTQREDFLDLVREVPNLRLFVVRRGTEYYDRRVAAAEESIGDLVVIGNIDEIAELDLLAFLDFAEKANAFTLAHRPARRPVKAMLAAPFHALGKLAGFKVDPSDFQTSIIPRTLLNLVLAHDEPRLALRFPPRDPRLPLAVFHTPRNVVSRTAFRDLSRRMQLFQTLLVYLTPTVLSVVSVSSGILALLGLAYGAYILGAVAMVERLEPGWLSTNTMLAVSAVFMGVSTLGLSLGLQHLLKHQRGARSTVEPEEINRIDLFQQVAFDLNVDLEREARTVDGKSG